MTRTRRETAASRRARTAAEAERRRTVSVKAAEAAGIRDSVKIMVGGAPVTEAFCRQIGADAYTPDAASAADKAVSFCA